MCEMTALIIGYITIFYNSCCDNMNNLFLLRTRHVAFNQMMNIYDRGITAVII